MNATIPPNQLNDPTSLGPRTMDFELYCRYRRIEALVFELRQIATRPHSSENQDLKLAVLRTEDQLLKMVEKVLRDVQSGNPLLFEHHAHLASTPGSN